MKILKNRTCAVCGCNFDVRLEKGNIIPIQYFYSKELGKALTDNETEYWECEHCSGYMKERMIEWMNKN